MKSWQRASAGGLLLAAAFIGSLGLFHRGGPGILRVSKLPYGLERSSGYQPASLRMKFASVGQQPTAVTVLGNSLYVAMWDTASVLKFARNGTVKTVAHVGDPLNGPIGLAGTGPLWVANYGAAEIEQLGILGGNSSRVVSGLSDSIAKSAHELWSTTCCTIEAGRRLLRVKEMNPKSGAEVATVGLPGSGEHDYVSAGGSVAVVTGRFPQAYLLREGSAARPAILDSRSDEGTESAVGDDAIWLLNGDGDLYKFSLSGREVGDVHVTDGTVGAIPLAAAGGRVYVVSDEGLVVVDAGSLAISDRLPAQSLLGVAADQRSVWVIEDGHVLRLDPSQL